MKITIADARNNETETFQYEDGIRQFVQHLNRASEAVHQESSMCGRIRRGVARIALQYSGEYTENVHTYVNNISTTEGGTHLSGFRTALTRSLNNYGKKQGLFKDLCLGRRRPRRAHRRDQRTRAPSAVRRPDENQAWQQRGRRHRQSTFGDFLSKYLEENPKTAKQIIRKVIVAAEARESARKARQLIRERKGALLRRRLARQAARLLQQRRRQV